MIRKILFVVLSVFSLSAFAVEQYSTMQSSVGSSAPLYCKSSAASAPDFCTTFPPAAYCNCKVYATPAYCGYGDMTVIYQDMLHEYKTLENACNHQTIVSSKECQAEWLCYWNSGQTNSINDGKPCNATGQPCVLQPPPPPPSSKL